MIADIIRNAGCVLLFWMGFQHVGWGAPPTSWSPSPPPGTIGWADHNWIRKMEIRSIGALAAAAHADCYLQTMQQTKLVLQRAYSREKILWCEKRETITVKWVKSIRSNERHHFFGGSFLLPSSEKTLPEVFQGILVLGSLISRQGCNYVQIKQPHFLEFRHRINNWIFNLTAAARGEQPGLMVIEHPWRSFMAETKQRSYKNYFYSRGNSCVSVWLHGAAISGTLHCIQTVCWTMLVPQLSQSQLQT